MNNKIIIQKRELSMISEDELREHIKEFVELFSSQREAAQALGISLGYLNDYIHGRRSAGNTIPELFKLKRVIMYEQAD